MTTMNQTSSPTRKVHPETYLGLNIDWTNVPNRNSSQMSELFPPPRPTAGGPLTSHPVIVPNSNSARVSEPLTPPPPVAEDSALSGQPVITPQRSIFRASELLAPPQPVQERPWSGLVDAEAAMQYLAQNQDDADDTHSDAEWQDVSDGDDETAATEISVPKYFGENNKFQVPRKLLPPDARRFSLSATENLSRDLPPERTTPPEIAKLMSPRDRLEGKKLQDRINEMIANGEEFPEAAPRNLRPRPGMTRMHTAPLPELVAKVKPAAQRLVSFAQKKFHNVQERLSRTGK